MRRARFAVGAAFLVLSTVWSACGEPAVDGQLEVAAELRALRTSLQQAPRTPADRGQLAAAMQPLREILDGLVAEQKALHDRQLALTQELQRWSQLLAQSVTGASKSESEALAARLQKLEEQLSAQDTRHREVEKLLGGALDRTADRLEQFLQRLEATTPGTPSPAPKAESAQQPAGEAHGGTPAAAGSGGAAPTKIGAGPPRRAAFAWWVGLLAAAATAGIGFALRLRRSSRAAPARLPALDASASFDRGIEELLAAAALLGDPAPAPAEPPTPTGTADEPSSEIAPDDVFVLEGLGDEVDPEEGGTESGAEAEVPTPAAARTEPATPSAPAGPELRTIRFPSRHPHRAVEAVLQILRSEPRVLRRPAPLAEVRGDKIEITFAPLPSLSAGERAALEQRVRDASSNAGWH